ncbi:recombinase family protein [Kitasatospora sp. NPDC087315]|uniref:recombinase family protein n=1 Tax=Kitasatospora sp. NPDC087315 TaxID=3364069 RepID=UPI0037F68651
MNAPLTSDVAKAAAEDSPRAITYARQSKRRDDDSQASPVMQQRKGQSLADARSYSYDPETDHYEDVGKSGWNPKVIRHGFEAMMERVRSGTVDVVIIYNLARLTRKGALDAIQIEAEMRRHGVTLISVLEPWLDTSTPVGLGIFAIIAGLAEQESSSKSEFVTDAKEQARQLGGHTAGTAPYGFVMEKTTGPEGVKVVFLRERPSEARVCRWIIRRIGEGKTPAWVAKVLNRARVPSPGTRTPGRVKALRERTGAKLDVDQWTAHAIRRVVRDPRMCGFATDMTGEKYEIRRDDDGAPMRVHDALVSEDHWYKATAMLTAAGKKYHNPHTGTAWLLSGWAFLYCECEATMGAANVSAGRTVYRCNRAPESLRAMGKRKSTIAVDLLEYHVASSVFSRLSALDMDDEDDVALWTAAGKAYAERAGAAERAVELSAARASEAHTEASLRQTYRERDDDLYSGPVGAEMFGERVMKLTMALERARKHREALEAQEAAVGILPLEEWLGPDGAYADPVKEGPWAGWSMTERREFLSLLIDRVVVREGTRGGHHKFRQDPRERIEIRWKGATAFEVSGLVAHSAVGRVKEAAGMA